MADDTQLTFDAQIWKRCPRCGQDFPRVGSDSYCRPCHAAYEREKRRRGTPSVAVQRRDDHDRLKVQGLKRCCDCFEVKPYSEFRSHKAMRDKLDPYCKPCTRIRQRANRERRGEAGKMAATASRYGLTIEALREMLARARCDACGATEPGSAKGWHVDHDHSCCAGYKSCGKCVRGLLCVRCNVALGMSNDSPDRLLALVQYLQTKKGPRTRLLDASGGLP